MTPLLKYTLLAHLSVNNLVDLSCHQDHMPALLETLNEKASMVEKKFAKRTAIGVASLVGRESHALHSEDDSISFYLGDRNAATPPPLSPTSQAHFNRLLRDTTEEAHSPPHDLLRPSCDAPSITDSRQEEDQVSRKPSDAYLTQELNDCPDYVRQLAEMDALIEAAGPKSTAR